VVTCVSPQTKINYTFGDLNISELSKAAVKQQYYCFTTALLLFYYCFTTAVLQVRQLLMKARLQDQIILMSGIQIDDSIIDEASMALATGNLLTSTPIRHKA